LFISVPFDDDPGKRPAINNRLANLGAGLINDHRPDTQGTLFEFTIQAVPSRPKEGDAAAVGFAADIMTSDPTTIFLDSIFKKLASPATFANGAGQIRAKSSLELPQLQAPESTAVVHQQGYAGGNAPT
jgi:hypothetical protein